MKAAVYYAGEKKLRIEEWPRPVPGQGEVLVKITACGVCHTDLHYLEHGVPTFKKPPLVLGHEGAGVVEEVGPGADGLKKGQRVLIPAVISCGRCEYCRRGRENICSSMEMFGNNRDGCYAEYVTAPAKDLFVMPDSIPLEEGCVIADALSTPYHAVKNRGQVQVGEVAVVLGCGGVGINVVQIASAAGAVVIAVDVADRKLQWAKEFGASEIYNPSGRDALKELRKLTSGGPDIIFEAIGKPATIQLAYDLVRPGGRVCVIGYTAETLPFSPAKLMYREVSIFGSLGCRLVDYPPLIRLVEKGKLNCRRLVTHRFPLERIDEAFELMKSGESLRSVVLP